MQLDTVYHLVPDFDVLIPFELINICYLELFIAELHLLTGFNVYHLKQIQLFSSRSAVTWEGVV